MSRAGSPVTAGTVWAVGLVLVALLGALAVLQWAGRDRAPFTPGAVEAVDRAVLAAGLEVCSVVDVPGGLPPASVGSRAYAVAAACPGDAATVVVDRFASAADRDATARRFEGLLRPRSSGLVLTLHEATVLVQGAGHGEASRQLAEALRGVGAR